MDAVGLASLGSTFNTAPLRRMSAGEVLATSWWAPSRHLPPDYRCDRCGQPAAVTIRGERAGRFIFEATCPTSGCVDELGSPSIDPPDRPGELTRADRRWIRRHIALIREFGRVDQALMAGLAEPAPRWFIPKTPF